MVKTRDVATGDLLSGARPIGVEPLGPGAAVLRQFAGADAGALMQDMDDVLRAAPLRHMVTPGGHRMSVAMSNCGRAGWVTDETGYRYDPVDPVTRRRWPAMPASFRRLASLAAAAGGFDGFEPDACLINRYEPGAKLSLHQDRNERDLSAPIVSVSLGLPAVFLWGGLRRRDSPRQRRRRRVGRSGAADLPRRRAARRPRRSVDRPVPHQPHVPPGALTGYRSVASRPMA